MGWWTAGSFAVIAGVIALAAWLARTGGAWRRMPDSRPPETQRRHPPHKQAADYFASGALPRWDP